MTGYVRRVSKILDDYGISETAITTGSINFGQDNLDYYEVDDWTPTITATGTDPTVTYTTQAGRYRRIGDQVTCEFYIVASAIGGSPTGIPQISGFPFTCKNAVVNRAPVNMDNGLTTGIDVSGIANSCGNGGYILGNSTNVRLYAIRTDTTPTALTFTEIAASGVFYGQVTYEVA